MQLLPTMEFRWKNGILQQKYYDREEWQNGKYRVEWIDVPVVDDDKETKRV